MVELVLYAFFHMFSTEFTSRTNVQQKIKTLRMEFFTGIGLVVECVDLPLNHVMVARHMPLSVAPIQRTFHAVSEHFCRVRWEDGDLPHVTSLTLD